jgi:hypothetical protein
VVVLEAVTVAEAAVELEAVAVFEKMPVTVSEAVVVLEAVAVFEKESVKMPVAVAEAAVVLEAVVTCVVAHVLTAHCPRPPLSLCP